jgi:hypothetical protein
MFNVEALAEKQSPMLGDIMRQWAEDQFTLSEFPQEEAGYYSGKHHVGLEPHD